MSRHDTSIQYIIYDPTTETVMVNGAEEWQWVSLDSIDEARRWTTKETAARYCFKEHFVVQAVTVIFTETVLLKRERV